MPASRVGLIAVAVATLVHTSAAFGSEMKDLYFGESLYYAYQEHYFEALERLDAEIAQHYRVDEPELDSLRYHIDHAEFSVGDFELYYLGLLEGSGMEGPAGGAGAESEAPHWPQNLNPGGFSKPQEEQPAASACPQLPQNFISAGLSKPQLVQLMKRPWRPAGAPRR